jgi:2-methylcitrate dehydratase PrpD
MGALDKFGSESATRRTIEATRFAYAELPADVISLAKLCLLDLIGVTVAGSTHRSVQILVDESETRASNAPCTIIGRRDRTGSLDAALINGTAGHALDYDDVNMAMNGHPTVPVAPALFAIAEQEGLCGQDLIAAFVTGYEAGGRIGSLVQPSHYARGFHITATVGTLSSALAAAALMDLDDAGRETALSIAISFASGVTSNFGTMCKPLHAGKAAQSGLMAARLARRGFTANAGMLEAYKGFAGVYGDGIAPVEASEPRDGFHIRDNLFKHHAACYGVHASIEAAHDLLARGVKPAAVSSLLVRAPVIARDICNIAEPRTGDEAKFSFRLAVALGMLEADTANPGLYSAETATDARYVAMRDRVRVEFVPDFTNNACELIAELVDGSRAVAAYDSGTPLGDTPRQRLLITAKFDSLAAPVLGAARATELRDGLLALEDIGNVADLLALARPD